MFKIVKRITYVGRLQALCITDITCYSDFNVIIIYGKFSSCPILLNISYRSAILVNNSFVLKTFLLFDILCGKLHGNGMNTQCLVVVHLVYIYMCVFVWAGGCFSRGTTRTVQTLSRGRRKKKTNFLAIFSIRIASTTQNKRNVLFN